MLDFAHDPLTARVVFGPGALRHLAREVQALGLKRPLLISSPGRRELAERAAADLGEAHAGIFAEARTHAPAERVDVAVEAARRSGADGLISCGGGAPIGIAKAVAHALKLPIVAIATTYSGSEVTPIWSVTRGREKHGSRSLDVLPRAVIYDPELTVGLPPRVTASSGLNAMAHAVEALYAERPVPLVSLLAEEAIRVLARALPGAVERPGDIDARSEALYGAYLAGVALGAVGMAIHHKLCHVLGGAFDLPHAETHAVILPHAAKYNAEAAPEALGRAARALGTDNAARGLYDLAERIGAPLSLAELGMPEEGIDEAARTAVASPYANPRPVDFEGVHALLVEAYRGLRP